jgi:two-component system OmpR family sensor kinase
VRTVVLTVADQGPGLTPDAAARIFERFYRADAARNRRDGGTGLGLAIVAALVAAHGGTVTVETESGAGACFRVELPLADLGGESAGHLPVVAGDQHIRDAAAAGRGTTST